MLHNPFTPSEIATGPEDFFGRSAELEMLEKAINIGSVAIQGAIGIGKSSLLANFLSKIDSDEVTSVVTVANRDIASIDDVARSVLENFISIDESQKKLKLKLPQVVEFENAEVMKYYQEGRHLAVLQRIIQKDISEALLNKNKWLVLAIDEADKCPVQISRFYRSLVTHTQQHGIKTLRFLFCGVKPFFQEMCNEDRGVQRFVHRNLNLSLLSEEEADDLLTSKFKVLAEAALENGQELEVDLELITNIRRISGGHPHLLQLLGSHVVEQENENPDGRIDNSDLVPALRRICFEDRLETHEATLHSVELEGIEDTLYELIYEMDRFPSRIERRLARDIASPEALKWFVDNNVLVVEDDCYGLVDEFLRIRIIIDDENAENRIITELSHSERMHPGWQEVRDYSDPIDRDDDY